MKTAVPSVASGRTRGPAAPGGLWEGERDAQRDVPWGTAMPGPSRGNRKVCRPAGEVRRCEGCMGTLML